MAFNDVSKDDKCFQTLYNEASAKIQNYMTNDLNLVLKVKFKAGKIVLWLRSWLVF